MSVTPGPNDAVRAFVPAKDFETSKAFYEALGFTKMLDADVAIFVIGTSAFILHNFYQKDFADNFMMQLVVDDLDAWWQHIESLNLAERFGVPAPKAPSLQPWGLVVAWLIDPSGVCWHIAQRPG